MYITTKELDKLTAKNFAVRLALAKSVTKADTADFIQNTSFDDKKVTSNKTKHVETEIENN